jgi:hypothetical protein
MLYKDFFIKTKIFLLKQRFLAAAARAALTRATATASAALATATTLTTLLLLLFLLTTTTTTTGSTCLFAIGHLCTKKRKKRSKNFIFPK